jgi:aspartyl-tRNA(Asn)/glutamyl-tRNA(Gln) amidotransferase subunit B
MEEGSMRADVNVSVRRPGEGFRTRCEIKNVNSIRFVALAVEIEARRHVAVWESGGTVVQQTRQLDAARGVTRPMRDKEEAHDYRYFPDPDLLPLVLDEAWVASLRDGLPELPRAKRDRFVRAYGLSPYDAGVLTAERAAADYFEAVAKGRDPKLAANWIMGDLFGVLNRSERGIEDSPVSADALGALLDLISDGTLSGRLAKTVFERMAEEGLPPMAIVERDGLRQVTDQTAIDAAVAAIMAANPDKVAEYRAGKARLFGFFVGQAIKAMDGKANPAAVNEVLRTALA